MNAEEILKQISVQRNLAFKHYQRSNRMLYSFIFGGIVAFVNIFILRTNYVDAVSVGTVFGFALDVALRYPKAKCPCCKCDWEIHEGAEKQTILSGSCPGCGVSIQSERLVSNFNQSAKK